MTVARSRALRSRRCSLGIDHLTVYPLGPSTQAVCTQTLECEVDRISEPKTYMLSLCRNSNSIMQCKDETRIPIPPAKQRTKPHAVKHNAPNNSLNLNCSLHCIYFLVKRSVMIRMLQYCLLDPNEGTTTKWRLKP